MKNTGIPYETITQHIFQQILDQEQVNTIKVEHDVIVQGKTAQHQIDVYWEFEVGGIKYITIVQAKDWRSPVKLGALLQFKGVIDDLPNQPRGIFVTKTGYQSGAKEFAKKNGIILYELREPNEKDWDGKVKTIVINFNAFVPETSNTKLIHDEEWMMIEKEKLNLSDNESIKITVSGMTDEIMLYDEDNNKISSVKDVLDSFYPPNFQELPPTVKRTEFVYPTFIHTEHPIITRIKLKAIESTISVSKVVWETRINGEEIIGFILKNVIEDTHQTFDKNLNLRKPPID